MYCVIMNATSGSCTHSNKKHLFLTGHPSVSKTTIIMNTIQHLHKALAKKKKRNKNGHKNDNLNVNLNIHGFSTEECRDSKGD